jgi:hypothetical protein
MTVRITLTSASGDTSLDVDLAQATARQEARLCDTCARAEAKTEETGDGTVTWTEHTGAGLPEAEDHRGLMDIEDAIALVALWAGEGE